MWGRTGRIAAVLLALCLSQCVVVLSDKAATSKTLSRAAVGCLWGEFAAQKHSHISISLAGDGFDVVASVLMLCDSCLLCVCVALAGCSVFGRCPCSRCCCPFVPGCACLP